MADIMGQSRQVNLTRSKAERLEAHITKEQKEIFQRAAEIQGQTSLSQPTKRNCHNSCSG